MRRCVFLAVLTFSWVIGPGPAVAGEGVVPSSMEQQQWVRLRLRDGSTLSGPLLEQAQAGITVKVGGVPTTIPYGQLIEVEISDGPPSPPAPAVSPAPPPAPPPPPPPAPLDGGYAVRYPGAPLDPLIAQYRDERLQLTDKRGEWVGLSESGYPPGAFRSARRRFFVIQPARPWHLTFDRFAEIVGDAELIERLESWQREARQLKTVGQIHVLVGASLITTSLIATIAAVSNRTTPPEAYGFAALAPFGVGAVVAGSFMAIGGSKKLRRLTRLEKLDYFLEIDEAFGYVDEANARLREELGLPDDPDLDAPEGPR